MKWQKPDKNPTTRYHLIIGENGAILDGACGRSMLSKPELQHRAHPDGPGPIYHQMCQDCRKVWSLVCVPIPDARAQLQFIHDVRLVKAAVVFAKQEQARKSLIKMLEYQVRKMKKGKRVTV